jgi:alpha-galactosidase
VKKKSTLSLIIRTNANWIESRVKFEKRRSVEKDLHTAFLLSSMTSSENENLQSLSNSWIYEKVKSDNLNIGVYIVELRSGSLTLDAQKLMINKKL